MGFISDYIYFVDRNNLGGVINPLNLVLFNLLILGIESAISFILYYGIQNYLVYRRKKINQKKREVEAMEKLEEEYEKWNEDKKKKA